MSFPGHEPVRPNLKYLQRDPSIQTLIAMRMNQEDFSSTILDFNKLK